MSETKSVKCTCPNCGCADIMSCPDALELGKAGELSTPNEVAAPLLRKPAEQVPPVTGWISLIMGFAFMALGLFAMRGGDLGFGLMGSLMGVVMAVVGFLTIESYKRRTTGRDYETDLALWEKSSFCDSCGTRFCGKEVFTPPAEPKLFGKQES